MDSLEKRNKIVSMNIYIRKAIPSDAQEIATIHVETWQDAYKNLIPDEYLQSLSIADRTKKWQEMLSDENAHTTCLVGLLDDQVLGWASVCRCRDEDAQEKWGELAGIYIHPLAQSKGLGSALMQEGLSLLKKEGYTQATLWVLTTNNSARNFYEAKGWRKEGKTKIDLRDGFELHETRYSIAL